MEKKSKYRKFTNVNEDTVKKVDMNLQITIVFSAIALIAFGMSLIVKLLE